MSKTSWTEVLVTSQVDGTALTAAAAASAIPAASKYTLPGNLFDTIGRQLMIKASGRISTVITTPGTARFDIRMGGTVVFDSQAILLDTVAAHNNVGWTLEILLTCRAIGAAGNFMGQGYFQSEVVKGFGTAPVGVLTAILPWNTAPVVGNNVDLTVSEVLDFFFTQTAATGSMTVHQYSAFLLN